MNERTESAIISAINEGKILYLRNEGLNDITPVRVMKHSGEYENEYQPIVTVVNVDARSPMMYPARFNQLFLTEESARENKREDSQ